MTIWYYYKFVFDIKLFNDSTLANGINLFERHEVSQILHIHDTRIVLLLYANKQARHVMLGAGKQQQITNAILCTPQLHTRHVYPSYVRDLLWRSEFVRVVIMLQRRVSAHQFMEGFYFHRWHSHAICTPAMEIMG